MNWAAGNVVLPTPDQDQQITWNANTQQLGRGANKIQLDGGTGNVNIPGTLSVTGSTTCGALSSTSLQVSTAGIGTITMGGANQSGQIAGMSIDHAIILRGDTTTPALNYSITSGDTCAFIENGGTWRFRQIREASNNIRMEITPTHVSIPTSLRVS